VAAWTEDPTQVASLKAYDRIGLWVHPEDLAVEQGELAGLKVQAINASWPTGLSARTGWSEKVSTWTQASLHDGATRAGSHFGAVVSSGETSDLATSLVEWAKLNQLQSVVAYRPFVGPWLTEALAVESAMASAGIRVIWRRRAWDTEHFPHATRGYFPFWERIKSAG
jgi:hypothetical protein